MAKANRLTLNVGNTFYIFFHRKRIKSDNLKLTIGQGTLKQTSQCKYLGPIIDNKLNWASHIAIMLKVKSPNVLVF